MKEKISTNIAEMRAITHFLKTVQLMNSLFMNYAATINPLETHIIWVPSKLWICISHLHADFCMDLYVPIVLSALKNGLEELGW